MQRRKHPRKHKITKYAGMWGDYYLGKMFRVPITLVFVYFGIGGGFITMIGVLALLRFSYLLWVGVRPTLNETASSCIGAVVLLCASLAGDYILYRIIRAYIKLPKGHLLNPLPPAPNEILPDAEVLVRASSMTNVAPSEILLRPAAATADTQPKTLLRAVSKTD